MTTRYLLPIVTMILVAGCSWMQQENLTARLLTEQSVLRVVQDDPARAQRVVEITRDVIDSLDNDGEVLSVGWLYDHVTAEIRWDRLSPADAQLVRTLLDVARSELEKRFGTGLLTPEQRFKVKTFLGWVEGAAALLA